MNITDIMIHVHPELSAEQREHIEQEISSLDGIVSVHFSPQHHQELNIAYNPEAVNSTTILSMVRQWDQDAVMAGL
ncbi:MAG: hypothetical protein HUJ30_01240 [Gammaproteobacteria bacterium]|nr:hypothetical protein [Gammaproteobacteria bacterium]